MTSQWESPTRKRAWLSQALPRFLLEIALAWALYGACQEFYQIAWGTGNAIGEFSLKWGLFFFAFVVLCVLVFIAASIGLWRPGPYARLAEAFLKARKRLGIWRWACVAVVLVFPIWLLQYTPWGVVIQTPYLRSMIWLLDILLVGLFLEKGASTLLGWNSLLAAALLTGTSFALVAPFANVSMYPFSLGWSEGNRLYDYSIMFGRDRYIYPASEPLVPYLDPARQLIGGLPFLIPSISIAAERFWAALIYVAPELILGWIAFRPAPGSKTKAPWFLAGLWTYLFLSQGPIHPPLAVSAVLTSLAWGQPLWLAGILIFGGAYLAQLSRFNWVFAASMWIGMLELSGAALQDGRLPRKAWIRAITLGVVGLLGGLLVPKLISLFENDPTIGLSSETVAASLVNQSLLWYRLLPNATYGMGILWGLLVAVLPLVLALFAFWRTKGWQLAGWQKAAIWLPLAAFLAVGLVASTKIGGGGDLHNVDMFLIGLVFTTAIAWRNGAQEWLAEKSRSSAWIPVLLLALVMLPARQSLMALYPLDVSESISWVSTLSDAERARLVGSIPSADETAQALEAVQVRVEQAAERGPVLFMDQRQLLTFGYIRIPLVADYDKKILIDKAMSSDRDYFARFYEDLAAKRFSLIVTNPLRASIQDSTHNFGEENNAWVQWVANPVLCYYEPLENISSVQVQLLVPQEGEPDCSSEIPWEK